MDKKNSVFLLAMIFAISFAYAKEVKYNDWVFADQPVVIDNQTYTFLISGSGDSLIIKSDNSFEEIEKNSCQFIGQKEFCVNGTSRLSDRSGYKAYLSLYYVKPKIEITRTVDNNILKVGEKSIFEVQITNTGDFQAKDINYIEEFPTELMLESVGGDCEKNGNKAIFNGDIGSQKQISCTYTIIALDTVDSTLNSAVFYNDGFSDKAVYSSGIRMYASSILVVVMEPIKSNLQLGEETELFINFSNSEDNDIDINMLDLKIPDSLVVTETKLEKKSNSISWSGVVEKESTKSLSIKLKAIKTGSVFIQGILKYEYDNTLFENPSLKADFNIEEKGIALNASFSEGQRIEANQNFQMRLRGQNLNEFTSINSINVLFETSLMHLPNKTITSVSKNSTSLFINLESLVPDVNTTIEYPLKVNISYYSEYGEYFSLQKNYMLIVEPINKIQILKTISPATIEENEIAEVTVELLNDRATDVKNVLVEDIVPGEFSVEGVTTAFVDLAKSERKKIYSYKIKTGTVLNETIYLLNTTVKYGEEGISYVFTDNSLLTVSPKSLRLSAEKSVQKSECYLGELLNVKYTIENIESEPAFDLILESTENNYVDTINYFNQTIAKLNPGEKIVFEKEYIRPKKEGSIIIDGSVLHFKDKNGRIENITTSSFTLSAKDSKIEGPAIMLIKSSSAFSANLNTIIEITLSAQNIGNEKGDFRIVDGNKEWKIALDPKQEWKTLYNISLDFIGEMEVNEAFAYYTFMSNSYRAESNMLKIRVVDGAANENQDMSSMAGTDSGILNNGSALNETKKSSLYEKSLLKKLVDWFKNFFKKKQP
ncbi:MAG: hypothetical protein V1859_00525 [archaeon]